MHLHFLPAPILVYFTFVNVDAVYPRALSECSCYGDGRENEAFCESGKFGDRDSCDANTGRCHWGPRENPVCALPCSVGSGSCSGSGSGSGSGLGPGTARSKPTSGVTFAEQWKGASNGYDYFTGEYSTYEIFDVSELGSDTIRLSFEPKGGHEEENVYIQIPKGIKWTKKAEGQFASSTKTFTDLSDYSTHQGDSYSKIWSNSASMTGKMMGKTKRGLKGKTPMPSATASFETAGSLNQEYTQSLKYMQAKSSTIIKTDAKIAIAEVHVETIIAQKLKQNFVNDLTALPTEPWNNLDKTKKDYYVRLFGDYGTHYVQKAELGGEFHHEFRSNKCYTNKEMATGSDFNSCARKKISIGVNNVPIKGAVFGGKLASSSNFCGGLTDNNDHKGEWKSSQVEEVCRMTGGRIETQCRIKNGIKEWVDAVQKLPHSTPVKIAELPRLLQQFRDNFNKETCVPCQQLKEQNLTRDQMRIIVDNLEEALLEYFLTKLEEKTKAESECNIVCGPCQEPAGPGCKCPEDNTFCPDEQNDHMVVKIDRVEAYFPNAEDVAQTKLFVRNLPGIAPEVGTSNEARSVSAKIGYTSLDGAHSIGKADFINIEVRDYHDGALRDTPFAGAADECIGSVKYPLNQVCQDNFYSWLPFHSGKGAIELTNKCSNSNASPKGGHVIVTGSIHYPNTCVRDSPCADMSANIKEKAIWISVGTVGGIILIVLAVFFYLAKCRD